MIDARKTEVEFFKKTAVYCKVPRSEVKKQRGKIISTRWVDTNKGYRGNTNYRETCRQGNHEGPASGSVLGHPAHSRLQSCSWQIVPKVRGIGIFDVSRAHFHAPVRPLFINVR